MFHGKYWKHNIFTPIVNKSETIAEIRSNDGFIFGGFYYCPNKTQSFRD